MRGWGDGEGVCVGVGVCVCVCVRVCIGRCVTKLRLKCANVLMSHAQLLPSPSNS